MKRQPIGAWMRRIKALEARAEYLAAYDESLRALEAHPQADLLKHRAVLNLARSGASGYAAQRMAELGLIGHRNEDIAALEARLAKDEALRRTGPARALEAARAARLYEAVHRRTGGYYPGINAATMHLVAGDASRAARLARAVERALDRVSAAERKGYYVAATRAEAALLRGRADAARWIDEAAKRARRNYAELASTRRQLRLICRVRGIDEAMLAPLAAPSVIHFLGHRIARPGAAGRFPATAEAEVKRWIADELAAREVGFGYGSLASGADILFAEALLARQAELHVVLPFATADFVARSVADSGTGWVRRFRACLKRATSVSFATQDPDLGHDSIFAYTSSLAMGLAVMRAHRLDAAVAQLAVWDGAASGGAGGTADDVRTWRALGLDGAVIAPPGASAPAPTSAAQTSAAQTSATPAATVIGGGAARPARAIVFADVKGFSKLSDAQVVSFIEHVMDPLGRVLDRFGDAVLYRNTWGDALYLVLDSADAAARCALALQEELKSLPLAAHGLPETLVLRIGGHFGPVWQRDDPVLHVPSFFGAHVSRAARIEPVAIPGHVFVSEPFAARLALETKAFDFEYVGERASAKAYGAMRMYLLRQRAAMP